MEEEKYNFLLSKLEYLSTITKIEKAYETASNLHKFQFRESGDPYIIHPLAVASILASMHADQDTICAGLLHDTLEDTRFTKQDIVNEFGITVANLVDGVTKEKLEKFNLKEEQKNYNRNKLIKSTLKDVRVMIIKIADRMHNMNTIDAKKMNSKLRISDETFSFYVPVSRCLNLNYVANFLENQSFKYLNHEVYEILSAKIDEEIKKININESIYEIKQYLQKLNIKYDINIEYRNIYSIYKNIVDNKKIKYFDIYVLVQDKDKKILSRLNNENITILTKKEYLNKKYGIITSWYNNIPIQEYFEKNKLDEKLLKINYNSLYGKKI